MTLNNGDKLVVTKKVASFLDKGDVVKVTDVADNGIISFAFGENFMHMGVMNTAECESHFEKIEEKTEEALAITDEYIAEIMDNSEFEVHTVFDKCTVVSCRLPNGFVITESSACVNPEDYDAELGKEICFNKIADKIWELEAYRLQQFLWEEEAVGCCEDCCDCCSECDCDEEEDECLDTDLDCDECEDFDCPYNTNTCC
jgi:hypothetical protein